MKILVYVGTGGVGKTSVAAAGGLKAALNGGKCLVLTIDPARRLRTALGLSETKEQQRVPLEDAGAKGELWAAMLDVGSTLDRAVHLYAQPKQAEVVLNHPIYKVLVNSLAGMQELLAVERLDQAIKDGFETVIIDTAPARHAFEFLDKPEFFAELVSYPLVQLVGRTYKLWEQSPLSRLSRASLELYSRVEVLLGATLVRQVLDFYSVFRTIAEGYAERARRTVSILRDGKVTAFYVATTPFKAHRDADYFWRELNNRKFPVKELIVNRMWPPAEVVLPADSPPLAFEALEWYQDVSTAQQKAWEKLRMEFSSRIPRIVSVPELPGDIDGLPALRELARSLELV